MSSVFFNKGENCIAAGRLFIEDSIHDQFLQKVVSSATGSQSCWCTGTVTWVAEELGQVKLGTICLGQGTFRRSCIKSLLVLIISARNSNAATQTDITKTSLS